MDKNNPVMDKKDDNIPESRRPLEPGEEIKEEEVVG